MWHCHPSIFEIVFKSIFFCKIYLGILVYWCSQVESPVGRSKRFFEICNGWSIAGVPKLGDASHWGDAKGLISVISWEHLYQWGDAIDVRGDADTIRLGTPGLVIKAEDSWLRGLSSNPPLKTQSFMHHSFESKERSKSKEWNVLTYPALLHVLSNPVNGKLAYKIQLKYEPAGQLIRTKFWPKNSFHNN